MSWVLQNYQDNVTLVQDLTQEIVDVLVAAIAQKDRATMAVSGGSTPATLFQALSAVDIPWSQVVITLVDERWVDEGDEASNARLVRQHLLQGYAAKANFVSLKTDEPDPFAAANAVDQRLRSKILNRNAVLDVVVLGMGDDGHTASYFKDAAGLGEALSPFTDLSCCAIRPVTAAHERMTLTLNTVLAARRLMLHFLGVKKWAVLETAMTPGPVDELPIRAVLHVPDKTVEIYYAEA